MMRGGIGVGANKNTVAVRQEPQRDVKKGTFEGRRVTPNPLEVNSNVLGHFRACSEAPLPSAAARNNHHVMSKWAKAQSLSTFNRWQYKDLIIFEEERDECRQIVAPMLTPPENLFVPVAKNHILRIFDGLALFVQLMNNQKQNAPKNIGYYFSPSFYYLLEGWSKGYSKQQYTIKLDGGQKTVTAQKTMISSEIKERIGAQGDTGMLSFDIDGKEPIPRRIYWSLYTDPRTQKQFCQVQVMTDPNEPFPDQLRYYVFDQNTCHSIKHLGRVPVTVIDRKHKLVPESAAAAAEEEPFPHLHSAAAVEEKQWVPDSAVAAEEGEEPTQEPEVVAANREDQKTGTQPLSKSKRRRERREKHKATLKAHGIAQNQLTRSKQ